MPNDARFASRQRTPSLSPFEARLCKSAEAVSLRLTELSASWRSMDLALVQVQVMANTKALQEMADSIGGMAERLERIATSLETIENAIVEINHRQWLPNCRGRQEKT